MSAATSRSGNPTSGSRQPGGAAGAAGRGPGAGPSGDPAAGGRHDVGWPPAVPGTRFADVRHLDQVGSTNTIVLEAAAAGTPEGLVVVADHQHAGRGRLDRRWEAPPGANLLVSILLRPRVPPDQRFWVVAAVALSAADACADLASVTASCKWPNDLLVADRKLAGVLAEATGEMAGATAGAGPPSALVVGIGLNVAWPDDPGSMPGATSLHLEGAGPVDRQALLVAMLEHLEDRLATLATPAGLRRHASEYRRRCATLGHEVTVELPAGRLQGMAVDIGADGSLLVDDGTRLASVAAGDVVHVRRP
jgi:BirA family biotin operon repressor/biotin-[acetyl-CoA-carboxylase] ligase